MEKPSTVAQACFTTLSHGEMWWVATGLLISIVSALLFLKFAEKIRPALLRVISVIFWVMFTLLLLHPISKLCDESDWKFIEIFYIGFTSFILLLWSFYLEVIKINSERKSGGEEKP